MSKARKMSEVLVGKSEINDANIDTGLILKRGSSQTANILEVVDSNDDFLNGFDKDGNLIHLHELVNAGETSQDLGDISGVVVVDLSKGQTIIMNVVDEITSLTFENPTGHSATSFRILLRTNGSPIKWENVSFYTGYTPNPIPLGQHGILGNLVGDKYAIEYLGRDVRYTDIIDEIIEELPPFKITVRTTEKDEEFALPLVAGGEYTFRVDWGDGDSSSIYGYDDPSRIKVYDKSGDYQITITGNMTHWSFNNSGSRLKVISVDAWGDVGLKTLSGAFYGCSNLESVAAGSVDGGDVEGISAMDNMFRNCYSLTSFPIIDTGAALTLSGAWFGCHELTSFPNLNTRSCSDFSYTWGVCSKLETFPSLKVYDSSNFEYAWYECESLISFPDLLYSHSQNLYRAWYGCSGMVNFGANIFDSAPGSNYEEAFTGCSLDLTSVDNILVSVNLSGVATGVMRLGIDSGLNSPPSLDGIVAKEMLESKGWIVDVNLLPPAVMCMDFSRATLIPGS